MLQTTEVASVQLRMHLCARLTVLTSVWGGMWTGQTPADWQQWLRRRGLTGGDGGQKHVSAFKIIRASCSTRMTHKTNGQDAHDGHHDDRHVSQARVSPEV